MLYNIYIHNERVANTDGILLRHFLQRTLFRHVYKQSKLFRKLLLNNPVDNFLNLQHRSDNWGLALRIRNKGNLMEIWLRYHFCCLFNRLWYMATVLCRWQCCLTYLSIQLVFASLILCSIAQLCMLPTPLYLAELWFPL